MLVYINPALGCVLKLRREALSQREVRARRERRAVSSAILAQRSNEAIASLTQPGGPARNALNSYVDHLGAMYP